MLWKKPHYKSSCWVSSSSSSSSRSSSSNSNSNRMAAGVVVVVIVVVVFVVVAGVGHMCLNVVNLSGNRITSLPVELHLMSSLHTLDVDRNPLIYPPTNVSKSFHFLLLTIFFRCKTIYSFNHWYHRSWKCDVCLHCMWLCLIIALIAVYFLVWQIKINADIILWWCW